MNRLVRGISVRGATLAVVTSAVAAALAGGARPASAQESVRERVSAMEFPELRFSPVKPRKETVRGVPVYFAEDRELPLVTIYATFRGGVRRFSRDHFAAATALPGLMRTGGTRDLPPDSVDARIELLALATSFGQGGGGSSSWINTLTGQLDEAVALWADMLRWPRFDSTQVEVWRGAELERVRRRRDDPASLAFSRFNRIMYGDHPVGWEMEPLDLESADLSQERLRYVHEAVICPDNMVLGVAGDVTWRRASRLLEGILADWPPCSGNLLEDPQPDIRTEPGVFVIQKEIEQSVVVLAHSSSLRQGDTGEYFASRIANSILGASGLSSRLATELRTRQGLSYGASSIWTTSRRDDGLVGALTRTRPQRTLAAARLLLAALDSVRTTAPEADEVEHAVGEIVNGFVFNFRTPLQVVARGMTYESLGLPDDWLERYLDGIRDVTADDVLEVFRAEMDPARMTILLVGDTTRFDGSPSELGTVTVLSAGIDDPPDRPSDRPSTPREWPRSPQ